MTTTMFTSKTANDVAGEGLGQLLTALQVADALSISVRTVWRLVEKGQLPSPVRFNKKLVRFSARALYEWQQRQAEECDRLYAEALAQEEARRAARRKEAVA